MTDTFGVRAISMWIEFDIFKINSAPSLRIANEISCFNGMYFDGRSVKTVNGRKSLF